MVPFSTSSRARSVVSATYISRAMRHSERSGVRPVTAAPASTASQWLVRVTGGTRLMLRGSQPFSPASSRVSDLADTPATPMGGWGFW